MCDTRTFFARHGLRCTSQRIELYEALQASSSHPTAEELFSLVKERRPGISLATVYNTLRTFCDAGLLSEVKVDSTRSYFDTRLDDHAHYYWEDDGRVTDAPADAIRLAAPPQLPEGSELARVDVVIRLRRARD